MGTDAVCFAELCESFAAFAVEHCETAKFAKLRRKVPQSICCRRLVAESELVVSDLRRLETNPCLSAAVSQYPTAKAAKDSQSSAKQTASVPMIARPTKSSRRIRKVPQSKLCS
jgi:hypothetical protein